MPSNDGNRIHVNFNQALEILKIIRREAELEERSESSVVVRAVRSYYQQREREAELFTTRLHEAKKSDAPHFVTPPPQAERVSKIREILDQGKS